MDGYKIFKLLAEGLPEVGEVFPWDLAEEMEQGAQPLLLDVRERDEYELVRLRDSLLAPRGVLESAAQWGYEETVPELAQAQERDVVVICRSGNRSLLAAAVLKVMGFQRVRSLKLGLRGWFDYELPLMDNRCQLVSEEMADEYFSGEVRPEQMGPGR